MTLVNFRFAVIAALALATCPSEAGEPARSAVNPFSLDRLHEIHLSLTSTAWDQMQPIRGGILGRMFSRPATRPAGPGAVPPEGERRQPSPFGNQYAYVKAQIEFDGEKCSDIGLRFSGNSSYNAGGNTLQRPYKLDFNRFRPDAEFLGLKALNLHNNAFDPSRMREPLSYVLFRDAGLPASRVSYAAVYITVQGKFNRQYAGLFAIVEEVDKTLLRANNLKAGGLLLKPENLQGGIRSLGHLWNSQYTNVYRPKSGGTPNADDTRVVIDLANLVSFADDDEFRRRLDSLLDLDQFLRFLAMNTLLSNLDSYFTTGHNYYLYVNPISGRVLFLPWDMNLSFGSFLWVGSVAEQTRLSIHKPYVPPNRLIERTLAVDAWKQRYRRYLRLYADTVFAPDHIRSRVSSLGALVAEGDARWIGAGQVPQPAPGLGMFRLGSVPPPAEFIPGRIKSVHAQLDDAESGYEPYFQMRTMLLGPQSRPAR